MTDKNRYSNAYDDGNIPEIDLPKQTWSSNSFTEIEQPKKAWATEPLPESTRPRQDGPGGDGNGDQQR